MAEIARGNVKIARKNACGKEIENVLVQVAETEVETEIGIDAVEVAAEVRRGHDPEASLIAQGKHDFRSNSNSQFYERLPIMYILMKLLLWSSGSPNSHQHATTLEVNFPANMVSINKDKKKKTLIKKKRSPDERYE